MTDYNRRTFEALVRCRYGLINLVAAASHALGYLEMNSPAAPIVERLRDELAKATELVNENRPAPLSASKIQKPE